MENLSSFVVVAIAALVHASFQLSLSMLTLLGSHTIGRKRSFAHLLVLTNSFVFGAGVMTALLLAFMAVLLAPLLHSPTTATYTWVICCGILLGIGLSIWLFYYRKEQGTTIWLPRSLARYLGDRAKATKLPGEAFGLGLSSVIAELLFVFAPISLSALVLLQLSTVLQLAGIALYTIVSLTSLLIVNGLIGSGHSISRIQHWREKNKHFLQFAAGSGLIVLAVYVYINQVVAPIALAPVGGY